MKDTTIFSGEVTVANVIDKVNSLSASKKIDKGAFDNTERPVKKHELASLLIEALPKSEFAQINFVSCIPDVSKEEPYYDDVMRLYRSGIYMGIDEVGTFEPMSSVTAEDFENIVKRVELPGERIYKSLQSMPMAEGYELMYSQDMISDRGPLSNGWRYDCKDLEYDTVGTESATLTDVSTEDYSALYREFNPVNSGIITFEIYTSMFSKDNGVYIGFDNDDDKSCFKLQADNGYFTLYGKEKHVTDIPVSTDKTEEYVVLMHIDFDNHNMYAVVNGVATDYIDIPEDITVSRLIVGTTVEGTGVITVHRVYMYENYAMAQHFSAVASMEGKTPYDMVINGNITMEEYRYDPFYDQYSAKLTAEKGTSYFAAKSFPRISGKGIFEGYLYMPKTVDGAYFAITSACKEITKIYSKDGAWYVGDKKERSFFENVWQTLRIETDTVAKEAVIKINCKIVDKVSIDCDYIDAIKIGLDAEEDGVLWFDDISARPYLDHDDYPAPPKACNNSGYHIGVHVCNLWRDSEAGEGWQRVTPFEEFEPYLGYYDEGSAELADWEIKQMVEHGIDFQHLCWYMPESVPVTKPIKMNRNSHPAVHNGFFNAKYSDMMKLLIMWENGNGGPMPSYEAFKEFYWKYWKEYYFTDTRYLVIENKPVLSFCSFRDLIRKFGSKEGVKEALDFMREDIKTLGFDGMIFISWIDDVMDEDMNDVGIDAIYRYHYEAESKDANFQILKMDETIETHKVFQIPTVSVGYNYVPRGGCFSDREPMNTPEGFRKVAEHIRDEYLPKVKTGDWKEKMLFVSTWNEWTEGTYAAPSSLYGYQYLEAVKDVFTNDTSSHEDVDVMPTAEQKARITKLTYNKYQRIRRLMLPECSPGADLTKVKTLKAWDFTNKETSNDWTVENGTLTQKEGSISVACDTGDPKVFVNGNGLDVTNAPIIHFRLRTKLSDKMEVFFSMEDFPGFENVYKVGRVSLVPSTEFKDYYLDLSQNEYWTGTLDVLRVDPVVGKGEVEFELIEIMEFANSKTGGQSITVMANGREMKFNFRPELVDGDVVVTADPDLGFFTMLNLSYTWNRYTKIFTAYGKKHTAAFTVGSNVVIVDGKEQSLGYKFSLYDGLPVLRLENFCKIMGYECTCDDYTYYVKSTDKPQKFYEHGISWEFNIPGASMGWRILNAKYVVENDCFNVTDSMVQNINIMIRDLAIKTKEYSQARIGVRACKSVLENQTLRFFVGTTATGGNQNRLDASYSHAFDVENYKDNELYEIRFDLKENKNWSGMLKALRIDPHKCNGDISIDYVRLVRCGEEDSD